MPERNAHDTFDVEQAMFRLGAFLGFASGGAWVWAAFDGAFVLYFSAVCLTAGLLLIAGRAR